MRTPIRLLTAALVFSCSQDPVDPTPNPPPTVASVEVLPSQASFDAIAGTEQLAATARDQDGNALSGKTFAWSSSDQNVATVSAGGLVAAVANGAATISAAADGISGNAGISVAQVATQLTFVSQPSNGLAAEVLSPALQMEVQDANGYLVAAATDAVTLSLEPNAAGGTLSGTVTVTAVAGVATFTDLSIDNPGSGYTLRATATGLTDTTSSGFNVWPALPQFASVGVDTAGNVGENLGLAMGPAGGRHVVYYDFTNRKLRYATCVTQCDLAPSWTALDPVLAGGRWSAVDADAGGSVHLAYLGASYKDELGYASCTATCTDPANWNSVVVDTAGSAVGRYVDLAVDASGAVHLSYSSVSSNLYYAYCGAACTDPTNWQIAVIDTTSVVTFPTSIAVGAGGDVHITYYDGTNADLKYAACPAGCGAGANWQAATIASANDVGRSHEITVDGAGRLHVTYYDADLTHTYYASCAGVCLSESAWQRVAVDTAGHVGRSTTIAVDGDGAVHLGYSALDISNNRFVRYARCHVACDDSANWFRTDVEQSPTNTFWFVSMVLDANREPHFAYMDVKAGDVRYAR